MTKNDKILGLIFESDAENLAPLLVGYKKRPAWLGKALSTSCFSNVKIAKMLLEAFPLKKSDFKKYHLMAKASSDAHSYDSYRVTKLFLENGGDVNDINYLGGFYGADLNLKIKYIKLFMKHKIKKDLIYCFIKPEDIIKSDELYKLLKKY